MQNQEIARILNEMALLLEMKEVEFKPRAYEKAAAGVGSLDKEAAEIYKEGGLKALMDIPGVGKSIAEHIEQLLKKGTFKEYKDLKKKVPVDITGLAAVEGMGAKMVKVLWEKLRIKNIEDLEKAARAGKIRNLEHFGEKSEQKILKGIEFLKKSGGRQVLGFALPDIRTLEEHIRAFPEADDVMVTGSVRRRKETIGDIDILVTSKKPKAIMDRFVRLPQVIHVYAKGNTKTMVKLRNGLDADMRVVPKESWGAALNYFTGSKAHNVALRQIAIKKGMKLNEYGLYKGKKFIAGRTEEELYKALGLRYIEPEMRENTGEIEAARGNKLPKLISYGDLKGDLQIQTNWTDGKDSIEEMARAAQEHGLEYIAITDHTKGLAMTKGSDEKKLLKQIEAIEKINRKFSKQEKKIYILTGAEVNIRKDGSLDINDETLSKLDVVGAAVHSHFNLPRKEQTARVTRAMKNPHVDIIFHLTGRIINAREPIDIDIDEIIKAAKHTGTILEIDAYPVRLDIKDEYVRKCVEAGVKMIINSDAHATKHIKFLEHGIAEARRGWAEKKDVINTRPLKEFLQLLK